MPDRAPEWVDETEQPELRRPSEQEQVMEMHQAIIHVQNAVANLQMQLQAFSERGYPMDRTMNRMAHATNYMGEASYYFNYDVVTGHTRPTKAQRGMRDNYELS